MEKHNFATSDFYKCVIDIVEQLNRSISGYNFRLDYSMNSLNPDQVDFTLYNEELGTYTFICKKEEYKGGYFIVDTVITHIQEIIRLDVIKSIDPNVEYVSPEDLLLCHLTDCDKEDK